MHGEEELTDPSLQISEGLEGEGYAISGDGEKIEPLGQNECAISSSSRRRTRFRNPHGGNSRRGLWHVLLWQMGYYDEPSRVLPIPKDFSYPNAEVALQPERPLVTWVNHTTFLVEINGIRLLTDPVWSKRCSPFSWIGPKRLHEPPLALTEIGPIDYVLISHDHYDHLDRKTVVQLHALYPKIKWIVPVGVGRHLRKWGIEQIVELDWWQSHEADDLAFSAVPAQHFSGRTPFDRDRTLWCGFVVRTLESKEQKRFYFVGDTGYNPVDFKAIGEAFGSFDLTLVPIGAYLPRGFMGPVHASPDDAVAIHLDSRSRLSVGSHFGTFSLSSEERHQPPYDLYLSLIERGVPVSSFRVLQPGQTINW